MIVLSQFAQHQKNGQILALVQMTSVKIGNEAMYSKHELTLFFKLEQPF